MSQPGEGQEREAVRVAETVMRMPEPVAATKAAPAGVSVPASARSLLADLGTGTPLSASERAYFEPRFGSDFSRVSVYTGVRAAESARSFGAAAFALGQNIVFAANRYAPGTQEGRRLIAHELAHTIQQREGIARLARQCDPAWATLPWEERVNNANAMASGAARNQCKADMLDEALDPRVTVEERTNSKNSVTGAISAGLYVERGTSSDLHVNFDQNLNAKSGMAGQYGQSSFRTPSGGTASSIFIILGPKALDPFGAEVTQMAFEHEERHAQDYLAQEAAGNAPHAATAGEELAIYTEGFIRHFLNFWTIDNTPPGSFDLVEDFRPIFTYFTTATRSEQDAAFDSIKQFFDGTIKGDACNEMKFKIWLQGMLNARPSDALVTRINAHTGFGLKRRTTPRSHFKTALGCT